MSHWTWSPPITVRMIPKPVGSTAPVQEQAALLTKPAEIASHTPKPEDSEQ